MPFAEAFKSFYDADLALMYCIHVSNIRMDQIPQL